MEPSTCPSPTLRLELPHDQLDDPPLPSLARPTERLGQRFLDDVATRPAALRPTVLESITESITSATFRTPTSADWRDDPLPTPLKTAQNPLILAIAPGFKSGPPR
jgi:hypothetical protein